MKNWLFAIFILCLCSKQGIAQNRTNAQNLIFTNEDSLHQGISKQKTIISGYGSAFYQRDMVMEQSKATLERAVLFVGHQFNAKISFFSEMEIENALVVGADEKGEIGMEQAFLKFNLNSKQYLVAGLFIPRIGILNENHLPVNFNGVERPIVETFIIPATWRELGVAFYGKSDRLPILYSIGLMNGLNSAAFEHGTGIKDGRAEGSNAWANNLAISASVQYNLNDFRFQVSGYAGGTVGLSKRGADSLKLNSGALGTPVYLAEANMQYNHGAISGKLLFANVYYPDAGKVNVAYAKNLAKNVYGGYAELGYNWLYSKQKNSSLVSFARFEYLDLNASIPPAPKGIYDGTLKQHHLIVGFSYLPIPNVVVKADVRFLHTGPQNPALVINPPPNALPYKTNNSFINLGIGYSF